MGVHQPRLGVKGGDVSEYPFPATILAVDLVSSSTLVDPEKVAARTQMYELLENAFTGSGVEWGLCHHEDRGDGVMVIVPVEVSKVLLLDSVLTSFANGIANTPALQSGWLLRARVAVHAGEIKDDGRGYVGSDVNHVFRLLDSDALREAARATRRRCVILVSDVLYQGIIRHGYGAISPDSHQRTVVRAKETTATAWLSIPGDDATARTVASREPAVVQRRDPHPVGSGVNVAGSFVGGDQVVHGDNAGRDLTKIENATFVQKVRKFTAAHPFLVTLLAVLLLGGGGYGVTHLADARSRASTTASGHTEPAPAASSTTTTAPGTTTAAAPGGGNAQAGGLRDPSIILGQWTSSDDQGLKSFTGNGGPCEGFFYANGQPLDIGGPMTCVISNQPDAEGRYTLRVTQRPNQSSYRVRFNSTDQATVYDANGTALYTLKRF
ncbi:hypothetical protein L6E12_10780 [Actinokineospora sp. PR83]|uniref:hypothetical protein n=1 Tax=Actinokineospora sp. PR83 TaxID=2884908 RepID=UPI001F2867F1|nr:hypothetical protein [Actinokineospora sp. PR83]MCG8916274.1 hypothetical protein [Actinokineospora sp. PR83]